MQSLHSFFNWDIIIKPMDLQQVYVWRVESFQARVDGLEDGLSRKTTMVHIILRLWHFGFILV